MSTITMYVEREVRDLNGEPDTVEVPVTVAYEWHRACRGARGGHGEPLSPDEPAHAEIQHVIDEWGGDVELTPRESEKAQEMAESHEEDVRESEREFRRED